MRLSIAQIVLGALIIFAACYVTGWMIHEAPSLLKQPMPDIPYNVTKVDVIQENDALFNIARYGSFTLPVFGVLILVLGTIQSTKTNTRIWNLMVVNMIAGVLIAALSIIIIGYGYPAFSYTATLGDSNTLMRIYDISKGHSRDMVLAIGVIFLLGLAVLGCGIAQLIKSRKIQISSLA